MSAEFETGIFVKHPAWHGQGEVLDTAPDTKTAFEKSGLNWRILMRESRIADAEGNFTIPSEIRAIVRDIDNEVLGYAKGRYEPLQNEAAFEWTKPLVESGLYQYEAAGSLRGGQKIWILLKSGEYEIVQGDKTKNYLLLASGNDGISPVCTGPTSIRVVCMNTLRAALGDRAAFRKIRHTGKMAPSMEEVRKMYMADKEAFARQEEWFKSLLGRPVNYAEREGYIRELIPIADDVTERQKGGMMRIRSFLGGMASGMASGVKVFAGMQDTAYGLFQAVTEGIEHSLGGERVKDRGENILFGTGADMQERAESLMVSLMAQPVGTAFVK